jgi:putative endonuclease
MKSEEKTFLAVTGEKLAEQYAAKQGYGIIARNYHSSHGEIDIIALDKGELVIIEVKTRARHQLQSAENSISKAKQKKITLTTMHFLSKNPEYSELECRFDVIIVFYYPRDETYQILHHKNAFMPSSPVDTELII